MSGTYIGQHDRSAFFDIGDDLHANKITTLKTYEEAAKWCAADAGSELLIEREDEYGNPCVDVYDISIDESGKTIPNRSDVRASIDFVDDVAEKFDGSRAYISTENGTVTGIQGAELPYLQVQLKGTTYFGMSAGTGGDTVTVATSPDSTYTHHITLKNGQEAYMRQTDYNAFKESRVVDFDGNSDGRQAIYQFEEVGWRE